MGTESARERPVVMKEGRERKKNRNRRAKHGVDLDMKKIPFNFHKFGIFVEFFKPLYKEDIYDN